MRRYWHPIAAASEMAHRWTMPIRLLGESHVLFKNRQGQLGLIEEPCPHRRASLAYGIPTHEGIRCPYHGWQFGRDACLLDLRRMLRREKR
jgi:5,5'-dehydrodivanillate O-demethylase